MDATQVAVMTESLLKLLNAVDAVDRDEPCGDELAEQCSRLSIAMEKNCPMPVSVHTQRLASVMALASKHAATNGQLAAVAEHMARELRRDMEPLIVKGEVDDFLAQFKRDQ